MAEIRTINQLGAYVRRRREELGLSQTAFAERSRIDRPWISRFEQGKANPTIERVFKILRALDVTLDVQPANAVTDRGTALEPVAVTDARIDSWVEAFSNADPERPVHLDDVFLALRAARSREADDGEVE